MKRLATFLLLASTSAIAASADYATQWPVRTPQAGAGAYALTLTPDVYDAVQHADLRDLDVLDARGSAVPVDIDTPAATSATLRLAPPWFAMPSPQSRGAGDWRVIADLDADGRLRALRSDAAPRGTDATTLLVVTDAMSPPDARRSLVALDLDWGGEASFDRGYRVEGSDDFDGWRVLGRGRLVDARQGGRALRLHRLTLDAVTSAPRYLRVVPDEADAPLPPITSVTVEAVSPVASAPRWRVLEPHGEGRTFDFDLPGRYPVRWVDLDTAGNDAREWRLQSRDGDGHWIDRIGGWVVYRVGARHSPAQVFDRPIRDRHWRLVAGADGPAPRLRLGYRPERVVFVAAGTPPYTLVAGSAVARRTPRPVRATLDVDDAPAVATLGPAQPRAGAAALERPRDVRTWGLWAVLLLGVAVVGVFAVRVLREPSPAAD